ncbi:MAG: hypothetical protein HW384_326 [Dehalococcoidia bacterium]|nr:hypothetical protein [Dehalococcoidia bacterium]
MLAFIDELKGTDSAASLYIPAGLSPHQIGKLTEKVNLENALPQIVELAANSKTGTAVFWSRSQKYLITPPFPIVEQRIDDSFIVAPLQSMLIHDYRIAIVLVRLGAYAIGLCQGENLIASKVGTGNIHSRHRQGGSSAKRFQRHREKQMEYFFTRVCGHAQEILRTEAAPIDYIVYGGAWTTILLLQKQCSFLSQFDNRNLPALLDIAEPRQRVLEYAIQRTWSSRIIEWNEDTGYGQIATSLTNN